MNVPRAVIFDLGGTLVDWPDWDVDAERRWGLSYDYLAAAAPREGRPEREAYARAMRAAELAHWERVNTVHLSDPPERLVGDGFRRLGCRPDETTLLAALDGYARAVAGWAVAYPDARETLRQLRAVGYRLGLLSNTWWAAAWHNADLVAHGLDELIDAMVYTSDLTYSKPHPAAFRTVAARLGVPPAACVMVGDRLDADVSGALGVGMPAVWKRHDLRLAGAPAPASDVVPTAVITALAELPALLQSWQIEV